MGNFVDHPTKTIIRERWCKPLLNHVYEKSGCKFVYMGLPAQNALDILCWIKYLRKVIVFQCRKYGLPSHPGQSKEEIEKLNTLLSDLEKKGLIDTYSLFDGYIEEVILKGEDNSRNKFSQNDIVTVYNLDFCNALTSPLEIWDWEHHTFKKRYKVEAIRNLLEIQRNIPLPDEQKKFIMFLTVHSQFWETEASKLLKIDDSASLLSYKDELMKLKLDDKEKNLRLLRLFVFQCLKHHFCDCNFSPDFLPPIYYKGIGKENWLVCFTIIGTYFSGASPAGIATPSQDLSAILKNKFLFANEQDITCLENKEITENSIESDPIKLFRGVYSYKFFK